jgi:DNA-binding Lrp family transcriptional regulator
MGQYMNYDDLPEDVISAIHELILSGNSQNLDSTDLDILRAFKESPQTAGDISPMNGIRYEAIRRRCDKLEKIGLIYKVDSRHKSKIFATGTLRYTPDKTVMHSPDYTIRWRKRDLTLQEFLIVLEYYDVLEQYRRALKIGIYHLAYAEKHPEQEMKPNGAQVRGMILNLAGQLGEMSRIFEKIASMTIYDNSIGARKGLSSINEEFVREVLSPVGTSGLSDVWESGIGPEGVIYGLEVAKAYHERLLEVRKNFPKQYTEEELLNAD